MSSSVTRWPEGFDLGDRLYERLLDQQHLVERRKDNTAKYPHPEVLANMMPSMAGVGGNQMQIYWEGIYGKLPQWPVDPDLLEQRFLDQADPDTVAWLYGRAGSRSTYHRNTADFDQWVIVPRMLAGVSQCVQSLSVSMWKKTIAFKSVVGIAPVGVQARITYPSLDADLHTARAAAKHEFLFVLSHVSSQPLEAVAEAMREVNPSAPAPWYQLYTSADRELDYSILRRAKKAGYGAVVVTLDTCKYGFRPDELEAAYLPQLDLRMRWGQALYDPYANRMLKEKFNCVAHESFSEGGAVAVDPVKATLAMLAGFRGSLGETWQAGQGGTYDLAGLVAMIHSELDLPVLVKGVLHPEDAVRALEAGADGVMVSNHGGRQVDGCISSITALPAIVKAVRAKTSAPVPIFLDSGIRRGQHVLKALALGATMTMMGRLPVMGLALGGQAGVEHVMKTLLSDIECTAINSGVASVTNVPAGLLVKSSAL